MARPVLDFHPAAANEIAGAVSWYLQRSSVAADDFMTSLNDAIDQITADPERAALHMHGRRAVRVGRFPYLVVYRFDEPTIRISAVAHTSRRPGYWKNRRFQPGHE